MENKKDKTPSKPNIVESFWNEKWVEVTFPEKIKSVRYHISNYGRIRAVNKITAKEKLLKALIASEVITD